MANGIAERQNKDKNLNYLAAQRSLYSKAKTITSIQLFISVFLIVTVSVVSIVLKDTNFPVHIGLQKTDISWFVAIVSVLVPIIDLLLLTPFINRLKEKAAKIQEVFDTEVLLLPWNEVVVGEKPDEEDVLYWGHKVRENSNRFTQLRDWYSPKVDDLPVSAGRLICQRSNLWWDAELRQYFIYSLASFAVLFIVLLLLASTYQGITLRSFFLSVLVPSFPVLIYSARQWKDNGSAIKELSRLKSVLNTAWSEFLATEKNESELIAKARLIQDRIFATRKNNPLIFDWVYVLRKGFQHESMNYSVSTMIVEYQSKKQM